ncbi:MAG: hypothetical protein WCW31_05810 [Patescibacteria group bacterium]|jgi:hypothetical protein
MKVELKKEASIKALFPSLLMFGISSLVAISCLSFSSPEYEKHITALEAKQEHETKQALRELEEAVAGVRLAESLKNPKSVEFVRLVHTINGVDQASKGMAVLKLGSLQAECVSKFNNGTIKCADKGTCEYVCLQQEFALLASDRFGRLLKGDTSVLTQVPPLSQEIVKSRNPGIQTTPKNLGIAWIIASFLAAITMGFATLNAEKWSRLLYVAAWILFFPAMTFFHVIWFSIFLPFWIIKVTKRRWRLRQYKKLIREIKPHLAVLWPEREPYRDRFADTDRRKLRVLSEDNKTPSQVRVRIAKLIQVEESLFGPLAQKVEDEPQTAGQPAERQPASQTA